ncbi:hypothetical protein PR202_gb02646 [Eleusine coracana subsp. coracana]|uniref:Exocyst subunit Exo70 family protein n=1 Tax=Eleusine coracana subsp. coracana TaxID=191504 RepID=A0AAV5DZW9_ELECO|nr:hypothetical protein PR202_gb02646 [Eleusine coracana subsp. coracana]
MCPTNASTPATGDADADTDATVLAKLHASRSAIISILAAASEAEADIDAAGDHLAELLSTASPSTSHLQSQAVATRALRARIDRAVAPAEPLLAALRRVSALAAASPPADPGDAAGAAAFAGRVDLLRDAIEEAAARGDEAVRRVEEAVGFLGRTKAAGRARVRRLTEAAAALRAVFEAEAEEMRFEGPLDDALLGLQDLFEAMLLRLKHPAPPDPDEDGGGDHAAAAAYELGTDEEVEAAARMATTLAANDCLDICLDIYVNARYRRAAKAMMRLNPAYLKSYTPEAIDGMEWESLESAMALWVPHFHGVAVARCSPPSAPSAPACSGKIIPSSRPRCGPSASPRSPPASPRPSSVVVGDAAGDPRALARAAAGVFFEFGLRVETHHHHVHVSDADAGHVPKIVRYAVNYLKCLASDDYRALMDAALLAERDPELHDLHEEKDEDKVNGRSSPLAEAAASVMEALRRHVETARRACGDAVAAHVTAMNAYWYMYMRARGSELAKLVGEDAMRRRYKAAAEEAAWEYQDAAWAPLARLVSGGSSGGSRTWPPEEARERAAAFAEMLEDRARRHGKEYKIPDGDLRAQIKVAAAKAVRGAYAGFVKANERALAGGRREVLPVDVVEGMVGRVFDEMGDCVAGSVGRARSRNNSRSRRESRDSTNLEGFV